jgi:hypothetical protein
MNHEKNLSTQVNQACAGPRLSQENEHPCRQANSQEKAQEGKKKTSRLILFPWVLGTVYHGESE